MSEYKREFSSNIPAILPVIPLRNEVLFPQQFLPITVAREKSLKLLSDTSKENNIVAIITQKRHQQKTRNRKTFNSLELRQKLCAQ